APSIRAIPSANGDPNAASLPQGETIQIENVAKSRTAPEDRSWPSRAPSLEPAPLSFVAPPALRQSRGEMHETEEPMREEPRGSSRSQRACAVVLGALLLLAISLAAATPFTPGDANDKARDRHDVESPAPFHARGRLVCLAEEMKERFKAEVDPVHEHLLGFAVEEERSIGP